jgi:flagellar biosynthetic protein FliR
MIAFTDAQLAALLASFLLPLFRVLALMSAAPILSNRAFPVRVRVALSAVVALVAAPLAAPVEPSALLGGSALLLVAREVLIGLTIGFVARLLFASFEVAGEAVGLQMGLSYAGFFDPQSGQSNAVGRFVNTVALLAFVAVNGPLAVIASVVQSFQVFPAGDPSFAFLASRSPVQLGAEVFALALNLALPFVALLLFINLSLGVISRVAPQFNVFAVGFPVTIGTGLLLLAVGLPMIEAPLLAQLDRLLAHLGP